MAEFLRRIGGLVTSGPPWGAADRRRPAVPAALLAGLLLALGAPGARADEEGGEPREPDWIPSLSLGFDTFSYDTTATVENLLNPPRNAGMQSNPVTRFQLDIAGELMGPAFEGLPGSPRLFAQAGVQLNPFSSDSIFSLGAPGDTEVEIREYQNILGRSTALPPMCGGSGPNDTICPPPPASFSGEGSDIGAQFQTGLSAALGVAFSFPVASNLLLRVKPSVAYQYDRIDLSGSITTAVDTGQTENRFFDRGDPACEGIPTCRPRYVKGFADVPIYEVHRGTGGESIGQHNLGPGLEFELSLLRSTRPLRVTLYADARFLWLLSDRTTTFSDSSVSATEVSGGDSFEIPAAGPVASYTVRRDGFGIRGGAGLRFTWMGFGAR